MSQILAFPRKSVKNATGGALSTVDKLPFRRSVRVSDAGGIRFPDNVISYPENTAMDTAEAQVKQFLLFYSIKICYIHFCHEEVCVNVCVCVSVAAALDGEID